MLYYKHLKIHLLLWCFSIFFQPTQQQTRSRRFLGESADNEESVHSPTEDVNSPTEDVNSPTEDAGQNQDNAEGKGKEWRAVPSFVYDFLLKAISTRVHVMIMPREVKLSFELSNAVTTCYVVPFVTPIANHNLGWNWGDSWITVWCHPFEALS